MSEGTSSGNEQRDYGRVVPHGRRRISWAWLFPVLAAAATIWLFWSKWESRGPEIEIVFASAPGMQAGKTPLVYRGVTAGTVTGLKLADDLESVILTVRLEAFAEDLAREGTEFWIDQPVVGLGETSGLDALIQGNSLQARRGSGPPAFQFTGLKRLPLTPLESPSLVLKLKADTIPFLRRGSQLFHRGVAVGAVEDKALDENGDPYLQVVIDHAYANAVTSTSRFWPAAATSLKVNQGGIQLDLLGLKTILLGGIEFDQVGGAGEPAKSGDVFELAPSLAAAKAIGKPVTITFANATGILPKQTEIRHFGIPVGIIESVNVNEDAQIVEAVARFFPGYERMHTAGTEFTLVRPEISISGISGLETIATGVYVDCLPGGGAVAERFAGRMSGSGGLSAEAEREGTQIVLKAKSLPALRPGAPVLYRGLIAGHVKHIPADIGGDPKFEVVILKDFAPALAANARFWRVPATSVRAGPGVLNVDVTNLETLVEGAVAFDVFGTPAGEAKAGAEFELFASETLAKATSVPVRIRFDNGQGLLAGETQVRYLGLPVGIVESAAPKDGEVEAVVRFNEGYDFLRREGSAFSVVRLDVSLNRVAGLETVVSGIYIECVPAAGGPLVTSFRGIAAEKAEFEAEAQKGLEVVVTAPRSNIGVDAPVTYRGLVVGRVGRKVLSDDGRQLGLCVVIDEPYMDLVRENSQFWDTSGAKVSLGFFSIKVQSGSLASMALGGMSFATPDNDQMGARVQAGHQFVLHENPRREWLRWAPEFPRGEGK